MSIITETHKKAAAWLSYIAYTDPDLDGEQQQVTDIEYNLSSCMNEISDAPYTLVWGPATNEGVMIYVVKDQRGLFWIACRGTIKFEYDNILNWLSDIMKDLDSLFTDPWQWPSSGESVDGAFVTAGMTDALTDIINQPGSDLIQNDGSTLTLLAFLQKYLPKDASSVIVTGHSLGAALANLVAVCLAYEFQSTQPSLQFVPFTFAAPTVSNDIFQSQVFSNYCKSSWQYVNSLDIVPMCWNNLVGVADAYTPPDWCHSLLFWDNIGLWATIRLAAILIKDGGYNFTPVSAPVLFDGTLDSSLGWTDDVKAQHELGGFYFQSLNLKVPKDKIKGITLLGPGDIKIPARAEIGVKTKNKNKNKTKLQITVSE